MMSMACYSVLLICAGNLTYLASQTLVIKGNPGVLLALHLHDQVTTPSQVSPPHKLSSKASILECVPVLAWG